MARLNAKRFIVICLLFGCFNAYAVSMSTRQQFIKFMVPKIRQANQDVMRLRSKIENLHILWEDGVELTSGNKLWLAKLAKLYRIQNAKFDTDNEWGRLLTKVDKLPVSMVLAQAINESAWGTSYFAREANNYFGIWCSSVGCGVVPRKRSSSESYEVRKFVSPTASVRGYLLNINRKRSYRNLRMLRAKLRSNNEDLDSYILINGLTHYSQLGQKYIAIIRSIILKYRLKRYDDGVVRQGLLTQKS